MKLREIVHKKRNPSLNFVYYAGKGGSVLLIGLLLTAVPTWPDTTEIVEIYRVFKDNDLPTTQQIKDSFFNLRLLNISILLRGLIFLSFYNQT